MRVNSNGADLSHLSESADRPTSSLGKDERGTELSVTTSGANVTPQESKEAPKGSQRSLDAGPKVDMKTNAYRKAVYEQTVRHNSTGGSTTLIREDR